MSLAELDSREGLGSDIARVGRFGEALGLGGTWVEMRRVRVVVGRWGAGVRLSAPELDVVADGSSVPEAWGEFVRSVAARPDSAWLLFDVGPTRREEVVEGLDAPEEEDWGESVDGGGS